MSPRWRENQRTNWRLIGLDRLVQGSRSLPEREELLEAFCTWWENLRWTRVACYPRKPLRVHHSTENALTYPTQDTGPTELIVQCLGPPHGEIPANLQSCLLGFEHDLKTFSMCPGRNLFEALEEWFIDG